MGVQAIVDTEQGRYDRDTRWDRAVGPMQFLPSTWRTWGVDGDSDRLVLERSNEYANASLC
jgi:membrane-bound lytic murein transglycosylase B